jgi:hypothetical protein
MKGCVLFGRFVWSNESKNRPPRARSTVSGSEPPGPPEPRDEDDGRG